MARKKASAKRNSKSMASEKQPLFLAFSFGLMLGAAAMYIVQPIFSATEIIDKIADKSSKISTESKASEITFTFIDTLKTATIPIPDGVPEQSTREDSVSTSFFLQTGSFKSLKDADSLRAQLLLLNMSASIEPVELEPGKTRYRVYVGPFTNESKAKSSQAKLLDHSYDSLLLEREI